jgi:hypothetical protein
MRWIYRLPGGFTATFLSYLAGIAASGALNLLTGNKMSSSRWIACGLLLTASCLLLLAGGKVSLALENALERGRGEHWSKFLLRRHYVYAIVGITSLLFALVALWLQFLVGNGSSPNARSCTY